MKNSDTENLSRFYNHGTFHFSFAVLEARPPQNAQSYTMNLEIRCMKINLKCIQNNGQYLKIVVFLSHSVMKFITVKFTIISCS